MILETIIAFIVILSILVLIHEFGHFIMAKKFGIKVEEFGVGFPPRAWGKKFGETLYSINWLPIGGFVKLFGEDEAGGGSVKVKGSGVRGQGSEGEDESRAFYTHPLWQRMTIVVAGVVMNFILAIVLISFLFATQGVPLPTKYIIVTDVSNNSPAQKVGLKPHDKILKIDGQKISDVNTFINVTKKEKGESLKLEVLRDKKEFQISLTPRKVYPKDEGPMGIAITNIEVKKYTWFEAPIYGTIETAKFSWLIVTGLGSMVFDFVVHGVKPVGVAGPVGVAQLTGEAVRSGWFAVLWLVALLSLNLGVLNILPIPALDGGRFFFMIIELVTRRKVNPKYESYAHAVGLVLLLGLMVVITALDISRLVQGKSILP